MIEVEKYLFVPYVKGGREPNGFDCWGLVLLVRAEMGLPALAGPSDANRDNPVAMQRLYKQVSEQSLEKCADLRPGDIAAVFRASVMVHVAVAVEIDGRIALLETNPGSGVRWMFLDRFLQTYYKVAFYRDRNFSEPS
jgi:hypothetical protein